MTAATLTHLPMAAGGAILSATGNLIHWSFVRFMRAPLANTGIFCLVTMSAMAGSNALYLQHGEHPAPLFTPGANRVAVSTVVEPVMPATRKKPAVLPVLSAETTGSLKPAEAPAIGRDEVREIQLKLQSMQLLDGKADGIYGPQTARAIQTFEKRMGLPPTGEVTFTLLEAVRAASVVPPSVKPVTQAAPVAAPQPVAEPEPAAEPVANAAAFAPLPAPAPLQVAGEVRATAKKAAGRQLPASPEEAFDVALETANEAIDTIVSGVQSVAMGTPGKRVQPLAAVSARQQPAVMQVAAVEAPKVGVPLAMPEEVEAKSSDDVAVLDTDARVEDLMQPFSVTDPVIVAKVQRGLASLGFLHGPADGVAGEATAKAIRNFEVYYNYKVTGRISPELLDLLVQNGAAI